MGSPDSYRYRGMDEKQHEVRITSPLYVGTHEVTQEQYGRVMGTNPSRFRDSLVKPVEMLSWNDAALFCRKLTERTGRRVRLPTEAEWEYACRAGSSTTWHFGNDWQSAFREYAWADSLMGGTHPVGTKRPNSWGLYDMHGNVWEWCSDRYDADYYGSSPRENPTGPTSGDMRTVRGGGWRNLDVHCRSAGRGRLPQGSRGDATGATVGFRVVVELQE